MLPFDGNRINILEIGMTGGLQYSFACAEIELSRENFLTCAASISFSHMVSEKFLDNKCQKQSSRLSKIVKNLRTTLFQIPYDAVSFKNLAKMGPLIEMNSHDENFWALKKTPGKLLDISGIACNLGNKC